MTGTPAACAATDHISLWDQVESELEARFGQALKDWAARVSPLRSVSSRSRSRRQAGPPTCTSRRADGQVVHWQVTLQNTIDGTHPDVVFKRVDDCADHRRGLPRRVRLPRRRGQQPARRRRRPARPAAGRRDRRLPAQLGRRRRGGRGRHRPGELPAVAPLPGQRRGRRAAPRTPSSAEIRPSCPGLSGPRGVHTLFAFLRDPDRRGLVPSRPGRRRRTAAGATGAERGHWWIQVSVPERSAAGSGRANRCPQVATARSRSFARWTRAAARSRCSLTRGRWTRKPRRSATGAPSP